MRREKVETISSQAVPSPARQRLISSAPFAVANAFAASNFYLSPQKTGAFGQSNKA
jgi:hypothetical protein